MDAMLAARRTRPLTIAGPRELRARMDAIREALFPGSHVMTPRFPVDWIEMEPGRPHPVLDLLVTPERARHTEQTNPTALRIQVGDKAICYTGDTEWTDEVARAARNTDLLIAECYFYDKPVKWHLNYPDIAAHAGPGRRPAADPHPHEPRDAGARGRRAGAVRLRRPVVVSL